MSLVDDQLIGLMVEKLILSLPGRLGQVHQFANSNARTSPLITVNYEDDIKSYSIFDSVNWAPLKESRDFFAPAHPPHCIFIIPMLYLIASLFGKPGLAKK
jgi:hypothetical protein